jgi:MoxR-like ATPase
MSSSLLPVTTREWFAAIRNEMGKAVIGQPEMVEQLLLTLLCREHALVSGPAGTAKWLAIESLGRILGLETRRMRCSSDLTPEELLGRGAATDLWQSSLLFVDNLDRLSPKARNLVQQAMTERVVAGRTEQHSTPDPFVVFAARYHGEETTTRETDDPDDDRFMFQIEVPYPSYHEEFLVAAAKSGPVAEPMATVVTPDQLDAWRSLVKTIEAPPSVIHYAVRLVRATRVHEGENPDFVYEWVLQGAGPRAAHYLILAAKARATLLGRPNATHADVSSVCRPVLRHRILTNQNARANGIDSDRVVRRLLEEVPPRIVGDDALPAFGESFTFHDWIPVDDGT